MQDMTRAPLVALIATATAALSTAPRAPPTDAQLIACARRDPACAPVWEEPVPPTFTTRLHTDVGSVDVRVTTAWAPAHAARFYVLSLLSYFDGSPLYRVLDRGAGERFVAQWGYRGSPAVDAAWLAYAMDNTSEAVAPPGNVRGAVAFGTGSVPGPRPNCTATECSLGFSVELYVNLADNARLDAADFVTFGTVDDAGLAVVAHAYAGYGECADLCAASTPPGGTYCVPDGMGGWAGVNLTRMLAEGSETYLRPTHPRLTYVTRTELLQPV